MIRKKLLAGILSAAMCLSAVMPSTVWADENPTDAAGTESDSSDELSASEEAEGGIAADEQNAGQEDIQDSSDQNEDGSQTEAIAGEGETAEDQKTADEETNTPKLTAELSADEKTVNIKVTGIDKDATAVCFPSWSDKNGQDDIGWIQGKKQEDGTWTASFNVKDRKNTGTCYIHCYQTVAGVQTLAGQTQVTVTEPTAVVSVENLDSEKGTFTVRISDLNVPASAAKVKVPVWGTVNGQNDIVWYDAVKDGEDYTVQVSASSHQYENGEYNVHCYITDGNSFTTFIGYTTCEIAMKSELTAEFSDKGDSITATATGINPNATVVYFPSWSEEGGQDDIVWTAGTKKAAGVWTASIPVSHFKHYGTYTIHCYQTVNGKQTMFDKTSLEAAAPTANVSVEDLDAENGTFTVRISDVNAATGVSKILVPIWGDANGQNDIVWYQAEKSGSDYIVKVDAADHKYENGAYNIHCYITDSKGIQTFAGKTEAVLSLKEGLSVTVSEDQMQASIRYIGSSASALRAAVWSKTKNQDDLNWYSMTASGNGATATVPITSHKTSGLYYVHIYNQANEYVTGTTFTIDPVSAASIEVSDINGSTGTFRVTLSGITSASGVSKVQIPVWSAGDQSNIYWYTAKKSGDTYYVDVNVGNHGRKFGTYHIHAYVYGNNGVNNFCQQTTASIEAKNYIYAEKTGNYTERVWLTACGDDITKVQFPTWSSTGDQDDIVWYTATKTDDGWYADVNSDNHKHSGTYYSHCYVTRTGSSSAEYLGAVSYTMATSNHNESMFNLAQSFSSDTEYLILINRGIHRVAIYQGSQGSWKEVKYWKCVVGAPATPTPTGTFKIKGRFSWFGDGHKCWWATQIEGYYYFHSVLYYWDDAPNKILDGTMDAAASHGCVRLDEPNARWIYTTIPRGTTVHIYN